MITGIWKKAHLVCGNPCHTSLQIMFLRETEDDVFYACPKYNPENRTPDEKPCMNRISIHEMDQMLEKLSDRIQEEEERYGAFYPKNLRIQTRIGHYKVLSCDENNLYVQALNKKAILK